MKGVQLVITFLLILSTSKVLSAQGAVSESEAISIAIKTATNKQNNGVIGAVKSKTDINNRPLLYEVIMADSSVVLLSGHKACMPLLGEYRYSGISIVDDFEKIPCGLKCLVNYYIDQVKLCYESADLLSDNPQWNITESQGDTMLMYRSSVEPLLHSKWGQSKSNDGLDYTAYNEFAPDSGCAYGSSHCPAGCVAVAMGQIMYFWAYPFFISQNDDVFNWCNMSDELRTDNPCYEANKKAINTLLKACGKSVNMAYHCHGSESYLLYTEVALKEVFHYDSDIESFTQTNYNFSVPNMSYRIVAELDDGRPVLMRAVDYDHGGHAFICDGYNRRGKVHINWGWTGNFDGYYQIDNLTPGTYTFTGQFGIVYKIKPNIECQNQSIVYLDAFYSDYLSNSYFPYRFVPEQSDRLYSASVNSPSEWRTIPANASSVYQAHKEIVLQPGFTAEYGSDFTAKIDSCAACEERMVQVDMLTDGDDWQGIDTSQMEMRLYKKGDTTILFQPSALTLFPNPASNTLTVQAPNPAEDIQVFDLAGHRVYRWYIESRTEGTTILNIADIPTGNYILRIQTKDGKSHIGRFAKK